MKLLKKLAIGLAAIIAVLVLVGLVLPRQWHVERSIVIAAPSERIHPFIDTLQQWQGWAAWTRDMDPDVKWAYSGPESGVGATWAWDGPKMGHGRMTITASDPKTGVTIDEAIESEEINAHATLTYATDPQGTRVVWVDEGTLPPVIGGYVRGMIEKMLGENFETGLKKLKAAVESLPPPPPLPVDAEPAPDADGGAGALESDGGEPAVVEDAAADAGAAAR